MVAKDSAALPHASNSAVKHAVAETLSLVLAGGRGERLKSLTEQEAKPGLSFGGKYRLIDFPLSNCINSGIRKIGVVTQYRAHTLIHHVRRTWGFLRDELDEFVELWPAQQQTADGGWYAGTADAVFQNLNLIRSHRPHHVLILAGDHVYKQDYRQLISDHLASGADVTVSCIEVPCEEASRFGIIEAGADDQITNFVEKPNGHAPKAANARRCFASMGIYVFNADVLFQVLREDANRSRSTHDFGRDILPALLGRFRLFAHRFLHSCVEAEHSEEPYWRDVGTIDAYWKANMDLVQPRPAFDLYDRDWPIWTCHDQKPPARIGDDETHGRGTVANSILACGSVVSGGTVRRSLLSADAYVSSRTLVEDSIVLAGCKIGVGARVQRAILAEGCHIPDGMVVGEDGAEDARRFHVSPGGITLVTPKMLAIVKRVHTSMSERVVLPISPGGAPSVESLQIAS